MALKVYEDFTMGIPQQQPAEGAIFTVREVDDRGIPVGDTMMFHFEKDPGLQFVDELKKALLRLHVATAEEMPREAS